MTASAAPAHPAVLPRLTLILGGTRSGKSAHAERLVCAASPRPVYVATAQVWDDEMAQRVLQHQQRRQADGWQTVEEPLSVAGLLRRGFAGQPVLVDCLTLWLTNALLAGNHEGAPTVEQACDDLCDALKDCAGPVVLVSNEVGLGIVPDNALARRFRDLAGTLNQRVAALADRVDLVTAGLPLTLKPR